MVRLLLIIMYSLNAYKYIMFLAIHSCAYMEPPSWDLAMHKYSFLLGPYPLEQVKIQKKEHILKFKVQNRMKGDRIQSLVNHI